MSDFPLPHDRIVAQWTTNAVNGYVRVPDGHPWLAEEETYRIHNTVPFGEITYAKGNWFGFDTLHAGQWWPSETYGPYPGDIRMTDDLAIKWTQLLASDASEAGEWGGSHVI